MATASLNLKTDRIDLRMTEEQKRQIETAAAIKGMSVSQLLNDLMLCGISAITLNTTGSKQPGIRACVSQLNSEWHMQALDERLKLFVELQNSKK